MNKKFSTLVASLLLAGGMLSVANASDWTTDTRYVQNSKKYHIIEQTAGITGIGGTETTTPYFNGYYLTYDANDELVFAPSTREKDKNAYWTVTTRTNGGNIEYQLTNAEDKTLSYTYTDAAGDEIEVTWFLVGHTTATSGGTTKDANLLKFFDTAGNCQFLTVGAADANGNYSVDLSTTASACFDNVEISEEVIAAADLNAILKDGFGLLFGPGKDKEYKNLSGAEAFSGKITAVPVSGATGKYYFKRADGKYIVLSDDFIGEASATLNGTDDAIYRGYNFKAVSKHTFDTKINQNNAVFTVYKSYDFNNTDSLIVTLPYAGIGTEQLGSLPTTGLNQSDACPGLRVFVASSRNDDFLTTIEYKKANDRLGVQDHNNYATAQFGALAPYIQFGLTNIVDFEKFAGKVWNITDKDGKVLAPDVNWVDADAFGNEFDPATQVELNKPEGHWLPYYTDADNYGFVNRESGKTWDFADGWVIRSTNTPSLFEVYNSKYVTSSNNAWYKVYIKEAVNAELGKTENGYASFDEAKEALEGKYLTLTNGVTGDIVYIGKDADDNVTLTKEKSEAIEFRIKDLKHDYTSHDGLAGIDTLQHITTYMGLDKDGEIVYDAQDTVQFYHYRLFETFSEKYLTYDSNDKKFILQGAVTDNNAHEDFRKYKNSDDDSDFISTFVLKEKADGTYNLISQYNVEYDYCNIVGGIHDEQNPNAEYDNDMNTSLYGTSSEKMYGAFQTASLTNMAYIYNYNDNDRFAVANVDAPEYMTITGSQDTIKVSLKAQPNFFLYEQGSFLGMNHVADADMKAAIFVDTAYVRNNTYRPQYLLAMNGKYVEEVYDNAGHLLEPDTTYGRFLINAVDSANAWTGSKKTNPYIWESLNGTDYYRLVFVDGFHTADALTLHTAKADTKIALDSNDDKVCTFAFRYVDEAREGVKIETAYGPANAQGKRTRGWLKYQNNVPVVTNDYEDAHVFMVDNTTTETPTANDEISATEVSVIAGNGVVTIKGAEGKNVVITNVLGQQIANTVVSTSEATIAAPAGMVVVSVEGEAAVKAIVK